MKAATASYRRVVEGALLLVLGGAVQAGDFSLDWDVIAAGGGSSSGGRFAVEDTLGQPQTESMSGGAVFVAAGFWSWEAAPFTPALTLSTSAQLVQVGGAVFLTAQADYPSALTYQWIHSGTNLTDSWQVSGATAAQLTLDPVTFDLAGNYQVSVSGDFGTTTSSVFSLAVNRVPLAINPALGLRINDVGTTIPVSKLAKDADGDPLTVTAASLTSGLGTVSITASGLTYDAPATAGSASISYTVSDARGASVSGTVAVTIRQINASSSITLLDTTSEPGHVRLTASGLPQTTYQVQKSDDGGLTWAAYGSATTAANGVLIYTDTNPSSQSRLYRLAQ